MVYKYYNLGSFPFIEIVPMSDLHAESWRFLKGEFRKTRDYILTEPYRYTLFTGDIFEQAIKGNRHADVYGQGMSPEEASDWLEEELKPLAEAGRILLVLSGNHDKRPKKEVDHDPVRTLCKLLGIFDRWDAWEGVVQIAAGKDERHTRPIQYSIYATHGAVNGQGIGSPANRLERMSMKIDTDVYIAGHSHKAFAFPHKSYRVDIVKHRTIPVVRWFVGLSSFLEDGDYDAGAMLQPYGCTRTKLILNGKQKKISVSMQE